MYLDSSPVAARRSAHAPRLRSAARQPTTHTTSTGAAGIPSITAAARRARLADAIVSQWLLEQVPSDHRHARAGRNDKRTFVYT